MMHHIQLLRPINSGRWGTVHKAFDHKTKQFRAVKVLPKKRHDLPDRENARMINNEINNMMQLRGHPNVVMLFDVAVDDDSTYLIQELCGGNTLQETLMSTTSKLSHRAALRALYNITNAVAGCHETGILFVDVKPSNLVYSTEHAEYKLTDFGSSVDTKSAVQQRLTTATPAYASPELSATLHASFPHDVWSIGVIAHQLFYNCLPNIDTSHNTLDIQDPVANFIAAALTLDPSERPTAKELLNHPLLTDFKFNAFASQS